MGARVSVQLGRSPKAGHALPRVASQSGAIFTTTPDGGIVNGNVHYDSKIEVYLDGGPGSHAPMTAAGLPDGDHVLQVTDPPAEVLQDAGDTASEACSIHDGPDYAAGSSHWYDTNTEVDHSPPVIVVQFMSFSFHTPIPGSVCKTWIIPWDRYLSSDGDLDAVPKHQWVNPRDGRPRKTATRTSGSASSPVAASVRPLMRHQSRRYACATGRKDALSRCGWYTQRTCYS